MNENKFNGADELVIGHSEALEMVQVPIRAPVAQPPIKPARMDVKELHHHYTAAELELALLRAKSKQLDKRIADLLAAARLQVELNVKEKT